MNTYRFRIHVEGVGAIEETVSAHTPAGAQRSLEAKYAPRKVLVYTFVKVG